ncbi:oxysterol-binding protein-related protein 9-like [Halichondria panicea]|uniref:oxysterol-binding protein-related protein 9-like n=1 Tax=Halichondria panicea TaxID=6063 RepID=UPI00312B818C
MAVTTAKRFMEGPLSKWTNVVNGWQYRWFVLDQTAGLLSYFTSKDKMKRGSRRGCFRLKTAFVGIDDEDDCTFTIRVESRTYHFQAQNSEEREHWVGALDSCIRKLSQTVQQADMILGDLHAGVSLDQRLQEAQAYHSLLSEQFQAITTSLNTNEEAKQLSETIRTMMEALRQCIDMIKDSQLVGITTPSSEASPPPEVIPEAVEEAVEEEKIKATTAENTTVSSSETSSEVSRSVESESDDEFFDADNGPEPMVTSPSVSVPLIDEDPSDVEEDQELHEDNDTSSGVAQNKSVIMHMLSQVRIGMDLSKIVLPTFILEKRSLLEMWAELFSHADYFSDIPEHVDAKDRVVAIVKYYMSAFHAARKSSVAKKPYNPVLGEEFRCYWDLPGATRTPPDDLSRRLIETGPCPYASYNSLTFVAEQVSHHPPISAFYAEVPTKNMYVTGWIHAKSKFLGLSLGVHQIGLVTLRLLDYDEVYTCTLPNAYGRSILTVPWLELGGKVNLECEQTGFKANVEFHCKPFYGGKKHRVTADCYHVTEKKPFLKVDGEWNGIMHSTHPNGDQEVFFDTFTTPTIRKKIKRLGNQEEKESRRIWRHVTESLAGKDVEAATDAKHTIEEQQRADVRERKENGVEWEQKYFHLEGENWVYNTPLDKRRSEILSQTEQ